MKATMRLTAEQVVTLGRALRAMEADRDEWRALARELGAALDLEQRAHAHRRLCGHCDKESLDNGAAGCHRWYALTDGYSSGDALLKLREKEERDGGR